MLKTFAVALFALAMTLEASSASAAQCRDAKGKFIKCPPAAVATKCRDKTTKKFAKCSAPNTEPLPVTKP